AFPSFALKGQTIIAQGNALGIIPPTSQRPEGATQFIHQSCTDRTHVKSTPSTKYPNHMEVAPSGLVLRGVSA
ncbi:MAG: hypothetical protein DYG96_13890, partial [Chlorobi bacterium CHB2]|nr:hypothetical protein [Chlorobi bacterium CHB2]